MVINTWKQYWEIYEQLCDSLNDRGCRDITFELDKIKLLINGSRPGYRDFLKGLRSLVNRQRDQFTKPERHIAQALLAEMEDALKK